MSIYCAEVLTRAPDAGPQAESGPLRDLAQADPAPEVKVLLISQRPDGFFLERFNERDELVGETQHDELDAAMREAYSQYGLISDWRLCPDGVEPLQYIRAGAGRRRNQLGPNSERPPHV